MLLLLLLLLFALVLIVFERFKIIYWFVDLYILYYIYSLIGLELFRPVFVESVRNFVQSDFVFLFRHLQHDPWDVEQFLDRAQAYDQILRHY